MGSIDAAENCTVFKTSEQYLGEPRPIKIIVIGAGLSGIAATKIFRERFSDKPAILVIYEKNDDVTGTWLENRYPGCSCDVPAHAYTFSWEGNPNWSHAYVSSEELFHYFKGRAKAYGVDQYVHLRHRVLGCEWNGESGLWQVEVLDTVNNRSFVDAANIVINACGFLNNWKWPDISGLHDFGGHLAHSAHWNDDFSFKDKRVAVCLLFESYKTSTYASMVVKHLTSFNRSPTWVVPEFAEQFAPEGRETKISEEQKAKWRNDPESFLKYRKEVDSVMNHFFDLQYKDSKLQQDSIEATRKAMEKRLEKKPQLAKVLVPGFALGCRRITPGHGYLEALVQDNVDVRTDEILKITKTGIDMIDGSHIECDAIVCATGFDTSFRPFFPVVGPAGVDLRDVWAEEPRSYLSVAAAGFPNYFMTSGPNFPLANGALIPCLERCVHYAFDAAIKLQSQNIKAMSPLPEAVDDFQEYKDELMKDLVWSSPCRSWYKNGKVEGKVWGPWPGSSLHFLELMSEPRWEDWNFEYKTQNRFQYLGRGKTQRETTDGADLAWYITESGGSCKEV
ncbi:uncharacterized protein Z519_04661 [Cladophialophora bantiana CBS 173.52]|uniref:FAD/NAD(P)-binding domain-containing protein n=1 Tax=Cladophialophora bantiana (strain ATCC 10958 / CBS 173.52 / CDC B-1940 / NIH 8579) TaxID=1442370 RepID=A0A0D2ID53_CLAB1|nr:uncharacterized protein Z519_04661 [Cladophialophora bantiana CBS 173.52]KIW94684.1 hypothetical protein Z519_04661 [Cladophialophora bantiana CBS 173.52]